MIQGSIAMRNHFFGWLSVGTTFFVVGCALPVKIEQPTAGDQARPVRTFVVRFDKAFVPGSFDADLSGTNITNLFKPTPVPDNVSTASIEFPQFMDFNYMNTVNGDGQPNRQLLRVSAKSSSNNSCCDSVNFSPPRISIYRGGPSAVTYISDMPVRERQTIDATVWVKDAPLEPLTVRVTGHPSVSLNDQPAGQSITLVIPTNDNRVDFKIRGIVLSGEAYRIRAIATGYSSTVAGGLVLQAQ